MAKKKVYVRLKPKSKKAIRIGNKILYPNTEFCNQDFAVLDPDDPQVQEDLKTYEKVLEIKKSKPKEKTSKSK